MREGRRHLYPKSLRRRRCAWAHISSAQYVFFPPRLCPLADSYQSKVQSAIDIYGSQPTDSMIGWTSSLSKSNYTCSDSPLTCSSISDSDRIADYEVKLMDIDAETLGIPVTDYEARVTMPASEFSRIVRDLSSLSESVRIEVSKEGVRFISDGESANGSILLKQTEAARERYANYGDDDEDDDVEMKEDEDKGDDEDEDGETSKKIKKEKVKKEKVKKEAKSDDDDEADEEGEFKVNSDDEGEGEGEDEVSDSENKKKRKRAPTKVRH